MRNQRGPSRVAGLLLTLAIAIVVLLLPSGGLAATDPPRNQEESGRELMDEVRRLYESAREKGEKVPKDLYDWVRQDIQNIGDWEYELLEAPGREEGSLAEKLNEMGRERWELIWVETADGRSRLYFKRPIRSYLSQIPLSQLMKILPGGGESTTPGD